jgi:hypothetical protein
MSMSQECSDELLSNLAGRSYTKSTNESVSAVILVQLMDLGWERITDRSRTFQVNEQH